MGQGVFSLVALLVAEELDCDPSAITARPAPLGLSYSNPLPVLDSLSIKRGEDALGSVAHRTLEAVLRLAGDQMTGGSTSARNCWLAARRAGAGARSALLAAAARRRLNGSARCHQKLSIRLRGNHSVLASWQRMRRKRNPAVSNLSRGSSTG
jgi:isoquinoline 1-oxidoreductase beta subunit